jgi:hypothetical protein
MYANWSRPAPGKTIRRETVQTRAVGADKSIACDRGAKTPLKVTAFCVSHCAEVDVEPDRANSLARVAASFEVDAR